MKTPVDLKNGTAKQAKEAELQTWAEANSTGFKALNELIEREGLPLECYRVYLPLAASRSSRSAKPKHPQAL